MKPIVFRLCCFLAVILAPGLPARAQSAAQNPATTHPATTQTRTTHMTDPSLLHPATLKAKAPDTYEVTFTTTKGDFVVRVTRAWAPTGADRFYNLVKHHFFNGAAFFRVLPNFMVQFGLSPDPAVNRAWMNANIKDDPVAQSNLPGYVTFASQLAPNTRSTQVFINYANNSFLDKQGFAPFGQVISGMDVVKQIYSAYGENPDQGQITNHGRTYLEKNFPKLDVIKTAVVTSPAQETAHHAASGTPKP